MTALGQQSLDAEAETLIAVAHSLRGEGFDASEDGTGRGTPLVPIAIQERAVSQNPGNGPQGAGIQQYGAAYTLEARNKVQAVAFDLNQITSATNRSQPNPAVHHTLLAAITPPHLATPWAVRRLTPRECERLMGFPDDYTDVPVGNRRSADGARYKQLGNSWAVNCVDWLAERITEVNGWTE
ncbi:MAG: DNA cytosine methyltransferase [Paracoccaceae bacterium]